MKCEQFEQRLHELLDRRCPPETDELLLSHAQSCDGCRQVLSAQEALFDGLEMAVTPELSPDFTDRVLADLRPARRPRSFRLALAAVAAVAALVLLIVLPYVLFGPGGDTNPSTAHTKETDPSKDPETPIDDESRDPVGPTHGLAVDQRPEDGGLSPADEVTPEQYAAMVETLTKVTHPLRPVAESVTGVFHILRSALPRPLQGDGEESPQATTPGATEPVA